MIIAFIVVAITALVLVVIARVASRDAIRIFLIAMALIMGGAGTWNVIDGIQHHSLWNSLKGIGVVGASMGYLTLLFLSRRR